MHASGLYINTALGGSCLDRVDILEPATGEWTLGAPLLTKRYGHSSVLIDNSSCTLLEATTTRASKLSLLRLVSRVDAGLIYRKDVVVFQMVFWAG